LYWYFLFCGFLFALSVVFVVVTFLCTILLHNCTLMGGTNMSETYETFQSPTSQKVPI
jgi:hypothetical protein